MYRSTVEALPGVMLLRKEKAAIGSGLFEFARYHLAARKRDTGIDQARVHAQNTDEAFLHSPHHGLDNHSEDVHAAASQPVSCQALYAALVAVPPPTFGH